MKTSLLFSALTVGLSSFMAQPKESTDLRIHTADELSQRIVTALQQTSSVAYTELLPPLAELHQVMHNHAAVYGSTLTDAKDELANAYYNTVLPEATIGFEHLIQEGIKRGIDWASIRYAGVEQSRTFKTKFDTGEIVLTFVHNHTPYRLRITNALVIDGQWRANKHVQFI